MVAARVSPVFLLCVSAALRAKARRLRRSAQHARHKVLHLMAGKRSAL